MKQIVTIVDKKIYFLLALILIFSFFPRIRGINYQSLWLDELHTMNEADPDIRWSEMFAYLKTIDQHPPLHFILLKILFTIFGHTSSVARIPSAVAGTLSIWAIFLLGKEILNRNLGLIAALLTSVNYYNLYYSQEARPYIFAFLFTTLSFFYFIRLLKTLNLKNSVLYSIFTLLMMYSHYYGLMVLSSQVVLIIFFFIVEGKPDKMLFIKRMALSGSIIGVGYAIWLPYLRSVANIKSFWISPVSDSFFIDFFYAYFGHSFLLRPFLLLLLFIYTLRVLSSDQIEPKKLKLTPLPFSFVILFLWILVSYLVPYLRSLLVVPMLMPRYTIVVLPAYLIAISYGIELINYKPVKGVVLCAFVLLSVTDIIWVKKYYAAVTKTQFREMTAYVVHNNKDNYPIVNEIGSWQQKYYFKINNHKPTILDGKKTAVIDSIVNKREPKYNVNGFWIVGAHTDQPLSGEQRHGLDTAFIMVCNKQFYDAWAELYISARDPGEGTMLITHNDYLASGNATVFPDGKVIGLWAKSVQTRPLRLQKGKYRITVSARGIETKKGFPNLALSVDGEKIGDFYTSREFDMNSFDWRSDTDRKVTFKIDLTNDHFDPGKGQDAKAFIRLITIKKIE
jgi:mannosyltransferase